MRLDDGIKSPKSMAGTTMITVYLLMVTTVCWHGIHATMLTDAVWPGRTIYHYPCGTNNCLKLGVV